MKTNSPKEIQAAIGESKLKLTKKEEKKPENFKKTIIFSETIKFKFAGTVLKKKIATSSVIII